MVLEARGKGRYGVQVVLEEEEEGIELEGGGFWAGGEEVWG